MKIIASRDSVVASKCEWGPVCVWGGCVQQSQEGAWHSGGNRYRAPNCWRVQLSRAWARRRVGGVACVGREPVGSVGGGWGAGGLLAASCLEPCFPPNPAGSPAYIPEEGMPPTAPAGTPTSDPALAHSLPQQLAPGRGSQAGVEAGMCAGGDGGLPPLERGRKWGRSQWDRDPDAHRDRRRH